MAYLILSLLGMCCIPSSFGATFTNGHNQEIQQIISPWKSFQPAISKFNQPAIQFSTRRDPAYQRSIPAATFDANIPIREKFKKVVRDFANHFLKSLLSSQKYIDAFNLKNFSRERAAELYYEIVKEESTNDFETDAEFSGFTSAQAVYDNYDVVDSIYHMEVYAYTIGEFLYLKGVLTSENCSQLSNELLKTLKDKIDEKIQVSNEAALRGIIRACEIFLLSYRLSYDALKYSLIAIFSEMWYLLRH